ncbi:uncharacterized protein LOC130424250 isoform X3 [Triplophysa dalaica]|nr:uncharacterized protein LOC130424250 isoform X3 [Triplophysa dalaica]
MSLANLPPHIRSSTDHMSLVMLCREKDFKHFGHEKVFSRLIADLKDLEDNGITVAEETFKGTVLCIAGDNLGSHNVGGFTENFSTSEYFCRYCRIARRDFQTDPNACGPQRTPENYNSAVDILQSEGHQNVEGITCKSIFNSLNYFNVCMPGLPPCLGHDIFEGILSYDLALYLKYFIKQKKWFTYSILNRRIKQFKYSASDALSKPCTVSSNGVKLSGQAIQNWNFLRLLPVIMGDKVKEPMDDVWQLTLQLKDIVEMICAHRISLPDVAYLDVLIQEYLSCRFSLFPGHRLKPKHHYLRHYPALILKLGPLIRLWTMRFEKMGESEMNISSITSAIDVILPDLPITTKQSLEDTLKSLGVDTPEDFRFLQESDLVAVLRPIQARKFISVLKETTQISETPRQQHCPSQGSVLSQSSSSSSSRTSSPLSVKWVDSFEVPWKNFPEELMQALERQKRPSPQLRREMESGMEVHFKDLTGIPLKETFLESIDRKGNRLLHFMRNICANKNKRVLQAVAKLQVLRGQRNGCSEDVKDMILLLLSYFDEKEEVLLRYVEETSLAKDVELENLPVTPCIIVCGPSCYAAVHFMLAVDRKIVNDNITSFISAVCLMLGSYYSFNIHYPTELASVLEFLQRCFFLINPEKGTKVVEKKNKKRLLVNPRVFTLISDLSDHEWRETS